MNSNADSRDTTSRATIGNTCHVYLRLPFVLIMSGVILVCAIVQAWWLYPPRGATSDMKSEQTPFTPNRSEEATSDVGSAELIGTWRIERSSDGFHRNDRWSGYLDGDLWEFDADVAKIKSAASGKTKIAFRYTVDTSRIPWQMDFFPLIPDSGALVSFPFKAIWSLDGSELHIYQPSSTELPRPKAFPSGDTVCEPEHFRFHLGLVEYVGPDSDATGESNSE